jgi:alpha-mannosidase
MPLRFEKLNHLTNTLKAYLYRDALPITSWRVVDRLAYGAPQPEADDPGWRDLSTGELWGERMSWAWLVADITIPDTFANKPAALHLELEALPDTPATALFSPPEALVTISGLETPPQAVNYRHPEVLLSHQAQPGVIQVVLACFTGVSQPGGHQVRLKVADLVWIDRDVEALYWDARVLLDTIAILPETTPERGVYLRALNEAFRHIHWLNPPDTAFVDSVRTARTVLQQKVFSHSANSADGPRPLVHALGHAHIDVAWLWPLRVTRGKAARTFATALALMDQYPMYTFTQSQPHLYKMVAQDHPDLFARIKARIAEGRWNATGGTWVEPDTNLPGGESLVRQFLHGMRYFQRELGVRPEVLWLPDVFGYSAALPQIMRQAGIKYFFTAKLSWNQYTRYPYDTFWWEGLDGSRILTHLATTPEIAWKTLGHYATYNARMTPEDILGTWDTYQQKDANHHLMTAYGEGDGGGGPDRDMVERRARMENLPGLPQVQHSTAEKFFHALEESVPDDLPRWVGELYFQMHRGTYTSQSRIKRYNRKSEVLLHDVEALASIAYLLKSPYPHDTLRTAWETVLLHQFHDILPGSSIRDVYEDAERDYTQTQAQVAQTLDEALARLAQHIRYDEDMQGFAVFNTIGTTHGGPVEVTLPGHGPVEILGPSGRVRPFQWLDREKRRALLVPSTVPAYGHKAYILRPAAQDEPGPVASAVTATPTRLENQLLRAEFDTNGNLIRLYDLENFRDVLAPNTVGNQLWAYVDRPHHWDAWEVETYVQDQGWQLEPESVRLIESGPIRATLEVTYRFNHSRIVQRIEMLAGRRLLTFETDVDWHERHILLRTHFPLALRAMNATYEVQFGAVERPTHRNTEWDQAQHEVPAQQWADLSEGGYGVSLINDGKYGYSALDHVLTLSLLRAPTHPDPEADQGEHHFTYALYPHAGDWRQGTIAHAKRLNHPLRVHPVTGAGTWLPVEFGLVKCQTPGVVIDTVKKAEDSSALIVRVYEAHGGRVTTSLAFAIPVESAEEVNLLEEPVGPVDVIVDTLRFSLTPYQIRSFRVKLGDILKTQLG